MQLARVRSALEHEGPVLTVYLESRSPGEDAGEQVRKRWKALRETAANDGAGTAVLDAAESALFNEQAGEVQADGRVLAAANDDTGEAASAILDEPWSAARGSGDHVHWSQTAELGAMIREELRSVRMLVAVANQHGALLRKEIVAREHETRVTDTESIEGDSVAGVHKPREGALAHRRIQQHAEESVKHNAKEIASRLSSVAEDFRAQIVVLAGETKGRAAITNELSSDLAQITVEASHGGVDDEGAEEALADELVAIASQEAERSQQAQTQQFQQAREHGLAVQGADAVASAARMGAVATLLLESGRDAHNEAEILRACSSTDANVDLVGAGTGLDDGIGALLRFRIEGTNI